MSFSQHDKALVSPGAIIGEGTRVWAFANILEGAVIGRGCNICDGCYIEKGARLGDHVTLKNQVAVWQGITLEDDVFVGAGTAFINDRYPRSHRTDPWTLEATTVKKSATIGANCTVLCGLTIGEYSVVGAGSVVTKDVLPYTIVVGNPAKFAGHACMCGRKLNPALQCSCGKQYKRTGQVLTAK
jgi:UDP-2-acetamido-3-amino-2,3-dideoxy-glucuronate N-acetyltransferase